MPEAALIEAWRRHLASGASGLHLVDANHPLQIFVGMVDSGAARMVIRATTKPSKPALSDHVLIERYEDGSGKWNINFVLQDKKFTEVFLRLADDIHARSRTAANEATALDRVRVVIDEWRRLLKPRPAGVLSMDELRGLLGELWLLQNRFAETRSIEAAVAGWQGPLGLPQDFWYIEDGHHEAKAVGPSSTHVRISSEHQLDADELHLVVLEIPTVTEQTPGAVNLPAMVLRIRDAMTASSAPTDDLDYRLERLGVDLTEAFYQDSWFSIARVTIYQVDEVFPRIRASVLPTGLARVSYQLELAQLEPFKVSGEAIA